MLSVMFPLPVTLMTGSASTVPALITVLGFVVIAATALGGTVEVYTFVSETQGQTPIDYLLRVTAVPRPDHAAKHQDIINTLGEKFPGHTFSILPRFITPEEESAMVATPRSES